MSNQSIPIVVEVPREGLRRYSFFGLGYRHNEGVPDRRTAWPVARGIPLPRGAAKDVTSCTA